MIGDNIKAIRKEKGLKQYELSNRLHVSQAAVSQWERGISNPSTSQLISLSKVLGVSVSDLTSIDARPLESEDIQRHSFHIESSLASSLLDMYERLNDEGKYKLLDYASLLTSTYSKIKPD